MYKCNNPKCNHEFEHYKTVREPSGEVWFRCPDCGGEDFDEIRRREKNDKFLFVKKAEVIDYIVSAIACLNDCDIDNSRELLIQLIEELVGDTPFEYKSTLETVSEEQEADELIEQLRISLEVMRA